MKCNVCKFDNTPAPGESMGTHCEGCGTRIAGGDKPFPGLTVDPNKEHVEYKDDNGETVVAKTPDDPVVVDDELRRALVDRFPHVDDEQIDSLLVIKEATYHWGRGIGAEPDGYARDTLVVVEKRSAPCPECGCEEVEHTDSHGDAGICHSWHAECTRCSNVIEDGFSC